MPLNAFDIALIALFVLALVAALLRGFKKNGTRFQGDFFAFLIALTLSFMTHALLELNVPGYRKLVDDFSGAMGANLSLLSPMICALVFFGVYFLIFFFVFRAIFAKIGDKKPMVLLVSILSFLLFAYLTGLTISFAFSLSSNAVISAAYTGSSFAKVLYPADPLFTWISLTI